MTDQPTNHGRRARWDLVWVYDDEPELDHYLEDGWEPFAATCTPEGRVRIHLRLAPLSTSTPLRQESPLPTRMPRTPKGQGGQYA